MSAGVCPNCHVGYAEGSAVRVEYICCPHCTYPMFRVRDASQRIDALVEFLFTNVVGDRADTLVLTTKDGRGLGGYCESAVRQAIIDHLFPEEASAP